MLQALNILENADLKSMGYNSPKYMHTLYQAMSLAFADRDFYYGDPYFPPEEPVKGLLSKEYAKARLRSDRLDAERSERSSRAIRIRIQGGTNPFATLLASWKTADFAPPDTQPERPAGRVAATPSAPSATRRSSESFYAGTTSIEAADAEGWVVSVTPSGGWVPAVIAGRTGIGLSQRAQSFVTDAKDGPFNVIEPGKRPRVTLTPTLALKDGAPYLAFAVQGGDSQDQNLLQFFLNVVEFGMTVQQAVEAPNINSFQMRSLVRRARVAARPDAGRRRRRREVDARRAAADGLHAASSRSARRARSTRSCSTAKHGTMWGGSSNHGEDYGIAW